MSQTETVMLVALGFVLALVCVLLVARFVWSIGQRIARHRFERDKPSLIRSLEADRDQLRASHAVMQQKLDSKLAEAHARVAEHQAEVARHRNRVQGLIGTVNDREGEVERQAEVIRSQTIQADEMSAALAAQDEAITELRDALGTRDEDVQLLKKELEKTMELLDESKNQLVRLEQDRAAAAQIPQYIEEPAEPRFPPMLQPSQPVKPMREARRFDFNAPDQTVAQQPARRAPSELADLLSAARRNMMQPKPADSPPAQANNPMARVISAAQRLRAQKTDE